MNIAYQCDTCGGVVYNLPEQCGACDNEICDYCGNENTTWNAWDVYTICATCQKKVYDKVLRADKA